MLADEDATVDGHDVVLGEGLLQLATGKVVVLRLSIGGHQHGTIDNEKVGVGGGQTMTVVGVVDGGRHGEGYEAEARPLSPLPPWGGGLRFRL